MLEVFRKIVDARIEKQTNIDVILKRSWNDRNREIIIRFLLEKLTPDQVAALRHRLESIT